VLELVTTSYDAPQVQALVARLQQEYVARYGGPDDGPISPGEFSAPDGLFVVAVDCGEPVAMGGWRRHGPDQRETAWASPVAELKRMYVVPAARGNGHARDLLTHLEAAARDSGIRWMVLETGIMQPEAIALYRSSGYADVEPFGHYAGAEQSVHLGKQLSD